MRDQDEELARRLTAIELHLGELGTALAESMVLQAEFMTWTARFAQGGLPPALPRQAVEFSQTMLTEARKLNDASRAFFLLVKARRDEGAGS